MANLNILFKSIKVLLSKNMSVSWLGCEKIIFDLVLTMSVGVLLRLGVPLRKIGSVKKTKN
mgnify:CR=1 FL=1